MKDHRYLNPHWWALRLHSALETKLFDRIIYEAIGITSRFSPEREVKYLSEIVAPGKASIDIGAAYGLYAWQLSRLCYKCIAFEANPKSAGRLQRGLPQIETHQCALSDRDGNTSLRIPRKGTQSLTGYASIESQFQGSFDDWDEVIVPMLTLDSFSIQNVGFIKIDVEGHELPVLRGGEQTIIRDRPVLLIEVSMVNGMELENHPVFKWLSEREYFPVNFDTSPQNFLFRCRD